MPRTGCAWGAANGIVPEVLFFVQLRPDLLHLFNPQSREEAFACPRTRSFVSHILQHRKNLDPVAERALFRGTVGEAAAVEFPDFLKVWRELPHPPGRHAPSGQPRQGPGQDAGLRRRDGPGRAHQYRRTGGRCCAAT